MGQSEAEQVKSHEGLARRMARRYGMADEDGYQAARVGVLLALRQFDPSRGTKFSTLAVWLIRKELQEEMRARSYFTMHSNALRSWHAVRAARASNRHATDAEIAAAAGMTIKRLRMFDAISSLQATDFDTPARADGRPLSETLADVVDIEGVAASEDERAAIDAAVDALGERSATIIRLRMSGLTQRQVAEQVGISRSRVDQLEAAAMDRLRRVLLALLGPE